VPRRSNIPKREILPDPIYGSVVVAKLINSIMLDGKKGVAQGIVYDAFEQIRTATGQDPLEVFEKAMANIMPVVEVKARRVGGANYQVPVRRWACAGSRDTQRRAESARCPSGWPKN
jgi:small subunit ribosomal protein S7